ncbi:MAG: hypothetical protein WBA43_00720 [Elainellaceae cyanobacterium]
MFSQYSIGLHVWLLHQVQAMDAVLSAQMHDGQSEKSFSLSGLNGRFVATGQRLTVDVKRHLRSGLRLSRTGRRARTYQ